MVTAMAQKPKTLRQLVTASVAGSALNQTAWCKAHGINPRLLYRWLSGDVVRPQIRSISALATALGIEYEAAEAAVMAAKN